MAVGAVPRLFSSSGIWRLPRGLAEGQASAVTKTVLRAVSSEQGTPASKGTIWRSQLLIIFQAKENAFF